MGACALTFGLAAGCSHAAPRGDGPEGREPEARAGSTTQAIQGGSDDGAGHPYALGVCAGGSGPGQCQGICSGALILPNVVVTARHCVQQTPKEIDCTLATPVTFGAAEGVQWVTTNSKMFQSTLGWHHVKDILVPSDNRVCGHDIALIILDAPVPAAEAVPVIPGVQYAMGDLDRYTHSYTAIGYGKISPADPPGSARCFTSSSDYSVCPGARRIRQNIPLLCIPGDEFIPCPVDPALNDNEFIAGDGTCEGDSGSSAFETLSFMKGKPVTFGVLSRGGKSADGLTCKQSYYSRLDKWRDFVLQTAQMASANWTLYPKPVPDWTVYVPPPPDAGAPEAGKPKKPTNVADGTACEANEECKSKLCADTGAGKACAQPCTESVPNTCDEGFVCKSSVCVIDVGGPATPAATSSTTTSGCSLGRAPAGSAPNDEPWRAAGILAAVGLVLGARRGAARVRPRDHRKNP